MSFDKDACNLIPNQITIAALQEAETVVLPQAASINELKAALNADISYYDDNIMLIDDKNHNEDKELKEFFKGTDFYDLIGKKVKISIKSRKLNIDKCD